MTKQLWQSGVPPLEWDQHQTNLNAHFLQTRAWALFQEVQGKKIFHASDKGWSWVAILEGNRIASRLYVPYGPTAKSPESLKKAIEVLKACAADLGVDYVRIEPAAPNVKKVLRQYRAKHAHRDIQPRHTLIKDLNRPDEQLLSEMASTNRRLYRRASENGFSFSHSQNPADAKLFLQMIHEVAARTGIQPHSDNYYNQLVDTLFPIGAASLFIVEHNNKPVATCIAFEDKTTRYYAHAANAESARKLQPSVPLMGHLIFDAKEKGKLRFDYYGVAPPNAPKSHKWSGFSQFKRSFGGREVEYSGTWELPIHLARYHAYRLLTHVEKARSRSKKFVRRSIKRISRRY